MSSLDFEQIALVRVLRDRFSGEYIAHVDFDVHAEVTAPMVTIDGVMTRAADIVRAELRTRKTVEVPPVVGTGSNEDG